MAKVGKNVVTRGLSGKLGNQVVFRQSGDTTIVATAPGKRTQPLTEDQQLYHQLFKEAVLYAKSVMADPLRKAEYQYAAKQGESAFNLAIADYLKLPVVVEMDISPYDGQAGQKIRVRAIDNFKVVNVAVGIFKADNTEVESGIAASGNNGLDWFYTTVHPNPAMTGGRVVATVTDTPGHQVRMSQML